MKTESLVMIAVGRGWSLFIRRVERMFNSGTCWLMNGGHELYKVRNDPNRLYQQCLLCGYKTKGRKVGKNKDREK